LAYKSRTKRPRKTKIGRKIDHFTVNKAPQIQGQRSKVKVTRPTNVHTVNAQYLPNGKAYELQTWYTDGAPRPLGSPKLVGRLSTLRAIMRPRFKVKGQKSPGRLMLRPEMRHIFRTGRPTNFKLGTQTEHEDPHQRQAQ